MSLPTVPVAIAVNLIVGTPVPNARVTLELTRADVYEGIVVPEKVTVKLGADGEDTVNLWPNVLGTQGSQYRVRIYSQANREVLSALATVPNSPCNLHDILNLAAPSPQTEVQAHEAKADPHPQYTTQAEAAAAAPVQSVAGKTGAVSLAKSDVGLGNVDNTSDANKPVSTAQQAALDLKSDKTSALMAWALVQAFRVVTATRNSDGAITTASIVWPDGTAGTYIADTLSTAFPGATDAWHATYDSTPAKTVTQPDVTRDAATGAVTAQPAITIA